MDLLSYDQVRSSIQDGDIIFFKGNFSIKHPVDSLIMLVTGSPFVHCNIAFWCDIGGQQRLMAVEAQGMTDRRILNLSFYKDRQLCVVKAQADWNSMSSDALSRVATQKYGYFTAVYAGLRDLFVRVCGWRLPKLNHPGEICSEFVARLEGLSETDISPADLYTALLSRVVAQKPQ